MVMHAFHQANHAWKNVAGPPPLTVEGKAFPKLEGKFRTSNPMQILEMEIQEILRTK